MRRIGILVLVPCAVFLSIAWAQPAPTFPHIGRHQHPFTNLSKLFSTANGSFNQQEAPAQQNVVYDLGNYPGGSWSEPRGINNHGLVASFGDIPSGYTRPLTVPISGPTAGRWSDLGTLGGDRTDYQVMCMGVAENGMVVGHTAIQGDYFVHGFTWTLQTGMVDLGTLTDLGHNFSLASGVNKGGTLIVGWSSTEYAGQDALPVVWTPEITGSTTRWKIQQLDTTGFEQATYWWAWAVNNRGQIIGTAVNSDGSEIGVLWNPLPENNGWKIMQLPLPSGYPNAGVSDINNRGEIVGAVAASDWSKLFPAVWKPIAPRRSAYSVNRLISLTGQDEGWAEASGINERGDIVGDSYDAEGNDFATRWSSKDPNFIQLLGFPGTWSWAVHVNDHGVAVGGYGSDTVIENVAVVKFR